MTNTNSTHQIMKIYLLLGPSASRVFLGEERNTLFWDTLIWHAVCEYSGDGVKPNISWVFPDEDTVILVTTESRYDGIKVEVNLTHEFQLSQYEGKYLICLIQNNLGRDERRKIHVPKYCKLFSTLKYSLALFLVIRLVNVICFCFHLAISSIEVLNKTTLDRRGHGQNEHRLTLQENLSNQKILLRAHGNAPSYKTTCYRYVES